VGSLRNLRFILFPANQIGDFTALSKHRTQQVIERLHAAARIASQVQNHGLAAAPLSIMAPTSLGENSNSGTFITIKGSP
jgi:hypothetical protein